MAEEDDPGPPPDLKDVIDDLAIRFVVNCPAEEQESVERLLFQVEAAYWFFEDQYREIWPGAFPALNLLGFAQKLFDECELLAPFASKTKVSPSLAREVRACTAGTLAISAAGAPRCRRSTKRSRSTRTASPPAARSS